jgi:hypothetical protein
MPCRQGGGRFAVCARIARHGSSVSRSSLIAFTLPRERAAR